MMKERKTAYGMTDGKSFKKTAGPTQNIAIFSKVYLSGGRNKSNYGIKRTKSTVKAVQIRLTINYGTSDDAIHLKTDKKRAHLAAESFR
jgi:hypothetical protein